MKTPATAEACPTPKPAALSRAPKQPARAVLRPMPEPIAPARATTMPAKVMPTPKPHALAEETAATTKEPPTPSTAPSSRPFDYPALRTLAETYADIQQMRIQTGNRIKAYERDIGEAPPHLHVVHQDLHHLEKRTSLELRRCWRRHPLAEWASEQRGVGEHTIALLIGHTGDPADRPNPAKLWAYCGHGDPQQKRRTGMTQADAFQLGNPHAKRATYLIATGMLKAGNRTTYDTRRLATATRDWTDGHKHADALRITGKQFLLGLWKAAR